MSPFDLSDYVDVAERIRAFRDLYPEGSLQSEVVRWPEELPGFVAVKGYAYRWPDDGRPGIGHAWEVLPGRTPYTKDSELQNAETSAWGRAIVAALAADTKRGVASREEVRNRNLSTAPQEKEAPRPLAVETSGEPVTGDAADVYGEGTEAATGSPDPSTSPGGATSLPPPGDDPSRILVSLRGMGWSGGKVLKEYRDRGGEAVSVDAIPLEFLQELSQEVLP